MPYQQLEAVCAHYGGAIEQQKGSDKEARRLGTIIRNALGVLREDGVFAFYLFLRYRWEDGGKVIWPQLKALWQNDAIGPLLTGAGSDRDQVIALTDDLQALLLARDVAERTLVYALYALRAKG